VRRVARRAGKVLFVMVAAVALLAVLGLLLPRNVELVDTGATIEASSSDVFRLFNSRTGQQELWTRAWSRRGGGPSRLPPMVITDLGGGDAGVGTRLGFFPDGRRMGSIAGALSTMARGQGEIVESEPPHRVVIDIDFGFVTSHRTIELESVGAATTRVRWSESLDIANPLVRYVRFFLPDSIAEGFAGVLAGAAEITRAVGQSFSFAGVSLDTDLESLAATLPLSLRTSGYIRVAPEESTHHIGSIEIGPTRVRIGFELRDEAARPVYPACEPIHAELVARFGEPVEARSFHEEAMERLDRLWRTETEELALVCFRSDEEFRVEAVMIHPRG